ncbi:hypothetical protein SAMN05216503_2821 [Polaribacter sp. KT25b]|uniref:hypothetical protein n=1 Tax=Polaribacter sp. KT25b TaxID=1855336 RepID=UPI00087BD56C|nr:hypothetical protein [Polaribacter sp. KT25b]SDS36368.1 hypothetical protein SAMN05216503_2821 [Polaribacter sp. KT25b]
MKNIFLLFFTFLVFFSGFSQKASTEFPESAIGIYKGILLIDSPKGKQEIPMEFHLKKTDSVHKFNYVLMYNNNPRNYTLIIKDREKGIYEIDENNGIILPSRFANNTLYSFFEVQGNFLSSRFSFSENELDFEILFSATKNKTTTGGTSKEIPEVFGFPISVVQKAILIKEKN